MKNLAIQSLAKQYLKDKTDDSFYFLYKRVKPRLKIYVQKFIPQDEFDRYDIINDILSETFYNVLLNLNSYNFTSCFSTWLYKIAKNVALTKLRQIGINKATGSIDSLIESQDSDLNKHCYMGISNSYISTWKDILVIREKHKINKFLFKIILQKIDQLPEKYKDIIYDRDIKRIKYKYLAIKYSLPIGTIKSRIRLGNLFLSRNLKKYKKLYVEGNFE